MAVKCSAITRGGSRCNSPVLLDQKHCWMHSPEAADARREASRKGGYARSNQARAAKAMPAALTSDDLLVTLSRAIDKAEKGEIEPGIVNCISGAARTMNEIRKTTELERRLEELEARAGIGNDRRFG
jgi:hypothetical protein